MIMGFSPLYLLIYISLKYFFFLTHNFNYRELAFFLCLAFANFSETFQSILFIYFYSFSLDHIAVWIPTEPSEMRSPCLTTGITNIDQQCVEQTFPS